jgi:hypothetical protein
MPQKVLMRYKEFAEEILTIIASDSEEGRKKIVAIARRAEKRYELPVKSRVTGWFYQYTRTRGEKVEQSISVMENFPDAYTRLQEFKLMISEGEWKEGSYNYYLFLELISAIPDYLSLEETHTRSFVLKLKDHVMEQVTSFMNKYQHPLENKEVVSEPLTERNNVLEPNDTKINPYTVFSHLPTFWQQKQMAQIQPIEYQIRDQKPLVMG